MDTNHDWKQDVGRIKVFGVNLDFCSCEERMGASIEEIVLVFVEDRVQWDNSKGREVREAKAHGGKSLWSSITKPDGFSLRIEPRKDT